MLGRISLFGRLDGLAAARSSRSSLAGARATAKNVGMGRTGFNGTFQRFNSTEATTVSQKAEGMSSQTMQPLFESMTTDLALTNSPPDLILSAIENLHMAAQIPYWHSIVLLTIGMRVCLFPMGVKMAQSSARMAAVRPLLTAVTDAMKRDPQGNSAARKKQYSEQSKALLKQYQVNPFLSLAMPIIQLPIFMSAFFALKKMGEYFPGAETGGISIFTDLTAADSTMIFPVVNSITFLMMIELGGDGMAQQDQSKFKWVMRGLAFFMTPATMSMPTGVFVYWTANNCMSVIQSVVFKNAKVKKFLGMPDPPKASNSKLMSDDNPVMKAIDQIKNEFNRDPLKTEIVDANGVGMPLVKNAGPPPKTYSAPRKSKGSKKRN